MRFKEYLNECDCDMPQEDVGETSSIDLSAVNFRLADALDKNFLSPEGGISAIRRVLADFNEELPALYGPNRLCLCRGCRSGQCRCRTGSVYSQRKRCSAG